MHINIPGQDLGVYIVKDKYSRGGHESIQWDGGTTPPFFNFGTRSYKPNSALRPLNLGNSS